MTWWVKIHRQIEQRERYTDANTFRLFFHCIIKANHKDWKRQWQEIKKWSFITSLDHLAQQLHLSVQQIRTSLEKLESTWELEKTSTNKNTTIKVLRYCDYNDLDSEDNKQITNKQQTNNKQITTNNNEKNNKNIIYPPEFEEYRSIYPHFRKWKKKDTYSYWKTIWDTKAMMWCFLYANMIKYWIDKAEYVPACERRTKDFTRSEQSVRQKLMMICEKMIEQNTPAEEKRKLWDFFAEYDVKSIFQNIRERKKDLLHNSIINAK